MENSLHKTNWILFWCNLVGIFLFGGGAAMVSYLESNPDQGMSGAWKFLFAVVGLCLFGYGLIANHQAKDISESHGLFATVAWASVVAGVLGFIFTFVTTNGLGIATAVISLVAFICSISTVRK